MLDRSDKFAMRLASARKRRMGLSQAKLAALCGVHVITVLRWENGQSRPSGDTALRLAAALQTTVEKLLG